jgi:hypothetical protein
MLSAPSHFPRPSTSEFRLARRFARSGCFLGNWPRQGCHSGRCQFALGSESVLIGITIGPTESFPNLISPLTNAFIQRLFHALASFHRGVSNRLELVAKS